MVPSYRFKCIDQRAPNETSWTASGLLSNGDIMVGCVRLIFSMRKKRLVNVMDMNAQLVLRRHEYDCVLAEPGKREAYNENASIYCGFRCSLASVSTERDYETQTGAPAVKTKLKVPIT